MGPARSATVVVHCALDVCALLTAGSGFGGMHDRHAPSASRWEGAAAAGAAACSAASRCAADRRVFRAPASTRSSAAVPLPLSSDAGAARTCGENQATQPLANRHGARGDTEGVQRARVWN